MQKYYVYDEEGHLLYVSNEFFSPVADKLVLISEGKTFICDVEVRNKEKLPEKYAYDLVDYSRSDELEVKLSNSGDVPDLITEMDKKKIQKIMDALELDD